MAEPSYEELKARLAELEKQARAVERVNWIFAWAKKGGVSVTAWADFPVSCITSNGSLAGYRQGVA